MSSLFLLGLNLTEPVDVLARWWCISQSAKVPVYRVSNQRPCEADRWKNLQYVQVLKRWWNTFAVNAFCHQRMSLLIHQQTASTSLRVMTAHFVSFWIKTRHSIQWDPVFALFHRGSTKTVITSRARHVVWWRSTGRHVLLSGENGLPNSVVLLTWSSPITLFKTAKFRRYCGAEGTVHFDRTVVCSTHIQPQRLRSSSTESAIRGRTVDIAPPVIVLRDVLMLSIFESCTLKGSCQYDPEGSEQALWVGSNLAC